VTLEEGNLATPDLGAQAELAEIQRALHEVGLMMEHG
jgi:hypothetical protein